MNDFYTNWVKRTGVDVGTTDNRFAWALTVIFEKRNPEKAMRFAKWVISQSHEEDQNWFGIKDIRRVLKRTTNK